MEKGEETGGDRPEYSIIVPTYNARLNVALIVYLIFKQTPLPPPTCLLADLVFFETGAKALPLSIN
jgi:hypothetical protein